MSVFDGAIVRATIWQLQLLARLIARYDLPWVLEQEAVELTAPERADLVALLAAWHVGRRGRAPGEKASG